jgi:hypothetical protein
MALREPGKNRRMRFRAGFAAAGLLANLVLSIAGLAAASEPRRGVLLDDGSMFGEGNLERVRRFLAEAASPGGALDDYYFVLIGDIQNSVRSFRRDVFNAIARSVREAVDEKTGAPLYDKIRFVILLGDLVYEGPSAKEWEWLDKALAGRGPDDTPYPFLELLAREKPFFPVLGNHELLSFRPRPQTRYKDLFDSPLGVARFKDFFNWDHWIAHPGILYPVPADLPPDVFKELTEKLDPADRELLAGEYILQRDGRYHLKFFEHPPLREDEFEASKQRTAAGLSAVFRKAGYGTLPVLNSDNMIHYAFEAGNVVYLFLDSIARGWQYPGFSRLKRALYPASKDQHLLNLMTLSPFNGQSDFFRAVAAHAREHGKTLIPMMHSPTFNSSRSIYKTGVGYNSWLSLGLPQPGREKGDPTIIDAVLFSDVSSAFSACVHAWESFVVVARKPGAPDRTLRWYISGGGGGPLRRDIEPGKTKVAEELYNRKLMGGEGPGAGGSIEIRDDSARSGHHYLLVHVSGDRIVDVTPRFINPEDIRRPTFRPQLTLTVSYMSRPGSAGAALDFSPGAWGMEKFIKYLTFADWRPSLSLGAVDYNIWKTGPDVRAYAGTLELSPLTLDFHLPRSNKVALRLLGFEYWNGRANLRRSFLTTGLELPLFYDLFGYLERLNVGVKVYFPLGANASTDPNFGRRTKIAFLLGYRFKL